MSDITGRRDSTFEALEQTIDIIHGSFRFPGEQPHRLKTEAARREGERFWKHLSRFFKISISPLDSF